MTNRNNNADGDSLDLLLDTLTNSLGAFLLVALLIALLVTDASQSETKPSNDQLQVLENLELEIDTFLQQVENLQKRIDFIYTETKKLPDTISEEQVQLLKEQLAEIIELQEEQTNALNQIAELNNTIIELADENSSKKEISERENKLQDRIDDIVKDQSIKMREIKDEITAAQQLLLTLKKQLAQNKPHSDKQHREIIFPRVSSTNMQQFVLILKAGLLYNLKSQMIPSATGFIERGGALYRPTNGVKVTGVSNVGAILKSRLSGASPNSDYIKIFVWDDTFSNWNAVRTELAKRRFKLDITPMDSTHVIIFGGGGGGRVQ
jgi:hypothetical protein